MPTPLAFHRKQRSEAGDACLDLAISPAPLKVVQGSRPTVTKVCSRIRLCGAARPIPGGWCKGKAKYYWLRC